ncbi:hypothetical protein T09_5608 [Trichinella sp. T9]|nr:hypothetical protein T09_5608 [Trichinella sp. T9]
MASSTRGGYRPPIYTKLIMNNIYNKEKLSAENLIGSSVTSCSSVLSRKLFNTPQNSITSCVWQKLYHTIIGHVKGIQNSGSSTRTSAEVLAFI